MPTSASFVHGVVNSTDKLRHVVFVDGSRGRRRALNLSTQPTAPVVPPFRSLDAEDDGAGASVQPFLNWLFRQAGLDLKAYGTQTLWRRLPACLRVLRVNNACDARRLLERKPDLINLAINSLLIGVTSFFRDHPVFDYLLDTVLPELAKLRSGLRIWSAGCSDGAEIYSMGMGVSELGLLHRTEMLGTDCRSAAIAQARAAIYDQASTKFVAPNLLNKYFESVGARWQLKEIMRKSVQWRVADATIQPESGLWDVILCRNMAMYLKPNTATNLWQSLESRLRPGGYLVVGKAERPLGTRLRPASLCIYRREWG